MSKLDTSLQERMVEVFNDGVFDEVVDLLIINSLSSWKEDMEKHNEDLLRKGAELESWESVDFIDNSRLIPAISIVLEGLGVSKL